MSGRLVACSVYAKWVMFAEILGTNHAILLYFCRGVAL